MTNLISRFYNIHDLVYISVEALEQSSLFDEVDYQIRTFKLQEKIPSENIDITIREYSTLSTSEAVRHFKRPYFLHNGYFVVPGEQLAFRLESEHIEIYCERFTIPLNFFIQLVLLRQNRTLIHAAAVQFDTHGVLLPALGGVGKTMAIAALLEKGGKLFGDDLVILQDLEILPYPIDLSVYHYHLKALKIKNYRVVWALHFSKCIESLLAPFRSSKSLIAKVCRKILNQLHTPCFSVPVSEVFGSNALAQKSRISKVLFLKRSNCKGGTMHVENIDTDTLARLCTDILMHEWHQSYRILLLYAIHADFDFPAFREKTLSIIRQTLSNFNALSLTIPAGMTDHIYQAQLIEKIRTSTQS